MVNCLKTKLGDLLYTDVDGQSQLPSPEALKYKILIKVKLRSNFVYVICMYVLL